MKYCKKFFSPAGCLILALSLCSCSQTYQYFFDDENGFSADINRLFGGEPSQEISYTAPPKIEVSDYYTTSYDSPVDRNLTDMEIELYNLICYYIEEHELNFHFEEYGEDEVINAYRAVIDDHPEYFWMNKGYSYTKRSLGSHIEVDFVPVSNGTADDIAAKEVRFKAIADRIVQEAMKQETLYDKVLYVHDYLVDNTTYDTQAAQASDEEKEEQRYFDSSTAYGCLVNKRAVCSGYSAAFQYIMKRLSIPCGRISGKSVENGELHEWNYLTLGDYNYQMDVTWDDSSVTNHDGTTYERKSYDYFLVTTEEMEITHEFDRSKAIPECSGLEYNYYIYNGLYMEEYNFDYVAYIVREYAPTGEVAMKFGTAEECRKASEELIENNRIFDIDGVGRNISYILGSNGLTLTINV